MGLLVVIEGLDGAGKRTLADGVQTALVTDGATVARRAFPRYGRSAAADLVRDALYRRAGDLSRSVYGMAALYALDRADAVDDLKSALVRHDIVLLDRYVASNAAYGAARLRQDAAGDFVHWVEQLEIKRFGLPLPDLQLLLRVPEQVAAARASRRATEEADRPRDDFETDTDLQARVAAVYDELAARGWLSPWRVIDGADPAALARTLHGPA